MIYIFFIFFFPLVVTLIFMPLCGPIFAKAGKDAADAKVPIKNILSWLDIIEKPKWWLLLYFVPVINYLNVYTMIVDMLIAFGEKKVWERFKAGSMPLPFLLKYNKEEYKFIGPNGVAPGKTPIKKEQWREWFDAILYAVIAATAIRMLFFEAYTIPTSSMEKTLRVGDFLFVSKFHYGPRIPNTPLAFPFAHHSMPLLGTKAYSELIKLPYYRLTGFQQVDHNDMVVFNFPAEDTLTEGDDSANPYYNQLITDGWDRVHLKNIYTRPVDKRENYIKRCVAIAGDTIHIVQDVLYVNNKKAWEANTVQHNYVLFTNADLFEEDIRYKYDFYDEYGRLSNDPDSLGNYPWVVSCSKSTLEQIMKDYSVSRSMYFNEYLKSINSKTNQGQIFPHKSNFSSWDASNFGPFWIPKKGVSIPLNEKNYDLYARAIVAYEGNTLVLQNGKYILNGKEATSYTFKMDYYWMMGDNRNNSQDSRYWGYVPEDHVVGKAWVIWMSKDNLKGLPSSIRFNRIGTFVHSKYKPH